MTNNSNKYKKLVSNSSFFALGNFGSKFIVFLLLPLYTYQLTTEEYGTVDLIQNAVSLILPMISLSIYDALLRFNLGNHKDSKRIFTNTMIIVFISSIIAVIVSFIASLCGFKYSNYLLCILLMQLYQQVFSQYSKSVGKIKLYALNGILLTFFIATLNIVFLILFDLGIHGYLLSLILGNLFSNVFLVFKLDLFHEWEFSYVSKNTILSMLQYSIPLIPNSIAWWASNTINRYFILFFIGTSANGIFAVANRIPSLLSIVNSIFFQSWQLSAVEEYDSKDRNSFYTNVFNSYIKILFICTSGILVILKPLMQILVSAAFFSSWKYVPFLLLTVLYTSISTFFGQYYIAAKKTTGVFTTTIVGAIVNIILTPIMIIFLGMYGAGVSSSISFLSITIMRYVQTRKYVKTDINVINLVLNHLVIIFQIIILFLLESNLLFFFESVLLLVNFIINRSILRNIVHFIIRKHKSSN